MAWSAQAFPQSAGAPGASGAAEPRPQIEMNVRVAALLSYYAFGRGGAFMTLPIGASMDTANHALSTRGDKWFSVHASVFGPGVNWTGIKNVRPFYPSVLGAVSVGPRLSWRYMTSRVEERTANAFVSRDLVDRHIFSLDLSLMTAVTGEAFGATSPRCNGPLSAGVAFGMTWIP